MTLTEPEKKKLRGLGHSLKPIVRVGSAGVSDGVSSALEEALNDHQLVKVSIRVGDRRTRDQVMQELCESSGANLIQRIGNMALLFRSNPEQPSII